MVGTSVVKLDNYSSGLNESETKVLITGFMGAFLSDFLCVERFIEYIKKGSMKNFAYYRIIL